jgi:hypothetical protein
MAYQENSISKMKLSKALKKNKKWIIGGVLMFLLLASLSSNPSNTTTTNLDEIMRTSYLGTRNQRGIRNNNPLNIKFRASRDYLGKIPFENNTDVIPDSTEKHEQFESLVFGIAAAIQHLRLRYINGSGWSVNNCESPKKTFTAPFKTFTRIANVWAPRACDPSPTLPGGNNPDEYIRFVVGQTGIDPNIDIDPNDKEYMKKLIWGMSLYECGMPYKKNILSWENWEVFFNVAWTIYQ